MLVWTLQKMEENNDVRAIVDMRVPGKRPRGRPRGRWMDCVRRDMRELRFTPEDAQVRTFWRSRIRAADPIYWEKARKKKKPVWLTSPGKRGRPTVLPSCGPGKTRAIVNRGEAPPFTADVTRKSAIRQSGVNGVFKFET